MFLYVYLPDFNSVELVWSKVEGYLRKVKVRAVEVLIKDVKEARVLTK